MECFNNYTFLVDLILLFIYASAQSNLKIGVVEFKSTEPTVIQSTSERIFVNIQKYIEILNSTNLDLIVYPEDALTLYIPDDEIQSYVAIINLNDNPCTDTTGNYPEFVKNLSCAVRTKGQTYIVVNLVEIEKCQDENDDDRNCKTYGFRYYNTDIVFDTEGSISAKYRKYNLIGEYMLNIPSSIDNTIFIIKNETIGVFTCFDILYKSPSEDLVRKGVNSITYPSMWFSDLPFLTALQVQQMWSVEHNVNVYSANANVKSLAVGGSGIFYGKLGPVNYDVVAYGGTELLTNQINKNLNNITIEEIDDIGQQMDNFTLLTENLENYTSVILDTDRDSGEYTVCHSFNATESTCCRFNVKTSKTAASTDKQYVYHLVAYSGLRSYSGFRSNFVEMCGITACLNASVSSCGYRFPNYSEISWPITFEQIVISGNYTDNKNRTQYPNTLLSSIRPIHPQHFEWNKNSHNTDNGTIIERTLKLIQPQSRLLTFGIFGRNFALDPVFTNEPPKAF